MNWYLEPLKQYAVFKGRARRMEYWTFFLVNFALAIGLNLLALKAGIAALRWVATIYGVFTLIPGIAVAVRRMHDAGRSGWWILVPLVNLIFLLLGSQRGPNRYGADPHATRTDAALA